MSSNSEIPTEKIILLGEGSVGKTSLMFQFADNKFSDDTMSTIGIDFKTKIININGKQVKLQLWDTSGQEKFRAITKQYIRGAQGILIVFDVSRIDTFHLTKNWINSIHEIMYTVVDLVLVGNKNDLQRSVSLETAQNFANEYQIPYFETSAKNNVNVDELFQYIGEKIYKRVSESVVTSEKTVDFNEEKQEKSSCNC